MADNSFLGGATPLSEVWTIAVGGTWATGEEVELHIGVREILVTIGDLVTTADVALAIQEAWQADGLLDGTTDSHATSNIGGQEMGEFAELAATVVADVVTLTCTTSGKPVGLWVDKTSTSGTVVATNVQVATGPNHYNNELNWSQAALPAVTDNLILENTSESILYGLPVDQPMPRIIQKNTFTGTFGLPEINVDNPNKPYREYRLRAGSWNDATATLGTGSREHVFGLGDGAGSPMINMNFSNEVDGASSVNVYSTPAAPLEPSGKCLNLFIFNQFASAGSKGSLNILSGKVQLIAGSILTTVKASASANNDILINLPGDDSTIECRGGKMVVRQLDDAAFDMSLWCLGGEMYCEELRGSGDRDILADGGKVIWNTAGNFNSLIISDGGTFDAEQDVRAFAGDDISLYANSNFWDGGGRGSYTNGPKFVRCDVNDLGSFRIGQNKGVTIADI